MIRVARRGGWLARHLRGPLGRGALVGVVATVVDLGVLQLLIVGCGLGPGAANAPALLAGLLVQFFGNKHFAFRDTSGASRRQGAHFAAVEAVTFALNPTPGRLPQRLGDAGVLVDLRLVQ